VWSPHTGFWTFIASRPPDPRVFASQHRVSLYSPADKSAICHHVKSPLTHAQSIANDFPSRAPASSQYHQYVVQGKTTKCNGDRSFHKCSAARSVKSKKLSSQPLIAYDVGSEIGCICGDYKLVNDDFHYQTNIDSFFSLGKFHGHGYGCHWVELKIRCH
jgi:hypothetical protein